MVHNKNPQNSPAPWGFEALKSLRFMWLIFVNSKLHIFSAKYRVYIRSRFN